MSKVAIQGNASGTGTLTIAAPNTNTDRTLTLPDEAGTVLTDTGLPAELNATGSAPLYACRAWVNFNGQGTVAIRASGNVSSITDNGTGNYTVNFTTAMPDADYAVAFGGYEYTSSGVLSQTTTTMQFDTLSPNNGATTDRTIVQVSFFR